MDSILQLVSNPIEVFEETSRILLKIADNIISDTSNVQKRTLQKANGTIKAKILNVAGGKACLAAMGFVENEHSYTLPMNDSLTKLKMTRVELDRLKNGHKANFTALEKPEKSSTSIIRDNASTVTLNNGSQSSSSTETTILKETFHRVILPEYKSLFQNPFLKQIERQFHQALYYENAYLQERALSVIPTLKLENRAQNALRKMHQQVKKEKLKDPEVNLQDFLILELLAWFKNEFFHWVTSPACKKCGGETQFAHLSTDRALFVYTERIEMHKCKQCGELTAFPRYNDLNILLETRKGRCGEWANVFTLLCRAMGWEARYVQDETDHVWTEVYSYSQRKWLHCDACENVCDTPLMYESGWKKRVSYVMAYSGEEVQDVTWRYTSRHKDVLARRNRVSETELVLAMLVLREQRQQALSQSRREYLTKRILAEVVELMVEKQPTSLDSKERSSGGLDWRMARGEASIATEAAKYVWEFTGEDVRHGKVCVRYSSALNRYEKIAGEVETVVERWSSGAFAAEGVFRKEETDWKKSYICRLENNKSNKGQITWKFQISDKDYRFGNVEYEVQRTTFENGVACVKLCNDDKCVLLTTDKGQTDNFKGATEMSITAVLTGGKGDVAWQHAQLFREDMTDCTYTFRLVFSFYKTA